ncbi:uncharacterized protein LOC131646288 [Vicia villosa]|uniref:uncharacterized protein LOC131646288 n=1 Tax=Vicia villosa TaxID=3911 RepID=UPI00273C38CB|nr:uncharacterized protein LOC131646288 [Vicia villosa]
MVHGYDEDDGPNYDEDGFDTDVEVANDNDMTENEVASDNDMAENEVASDHDIDGNEVDREDVEAETKHVDVGIENDDEEDEDYVAGCELGSYSEEEFQFGDHDDNDENME